MLGEPLFFDNLRAGNVIKWVPEQSVVKLQIGDRIRLTEDGFERLSARSSASWTASSGRADTL
jgi:hypothetical protein